MRPAIGALISVNCRSSLARFSVAWARSTSAWAVASAWRRWSKIWPVMLPVLRRFSARSRSPCAKSSAGLGRGERGLRLVERRLVGPLVDGEEQVAGLDDGAVDEMDLVDIARDAGADVDLVDGVEAADEVVILDDSLTTGLATVTAGGAGGAPWPRAGRAGGGGRENRGQESRGTEAPSPERTSCRAIIVPHSPSPPGRKPRRDDAPVASKFRTVPAGPGGVRTIERA